MNNRILKKIEEQLVLSRREATLDQLVDIHFLGTEDVQLPAELQQLDPVNTLAYRNAQNRMEKYSARSRLFADLAKWEQAGTVAERVGAILEKVGQATIQTPKVADTSLLQRLSHLPCGHAGLASGETYGWIPLSTYLECFTHICTDYDLLPPDESTRYFVDAGLFSREESGILAECGFLMMEDVMESSAYWQALKANYVLHVMIQWLEQQSIDTIIIHTQDSLPPISYSLPVLTNVIVMAKEFPPHALASATFWGHRVIDGKAV